MRWAEKYLRSVLIGIQISMEYRANYFLWILSSIFPFTVQFFIWTSVFENSGYEIVYGYTYSQMIAYCVFSILVSRLIGTGFERDVLEDIKNGGLNKFIVKPINYIVHNTCSFLGKKLTHILVAVIVGIAASIMLNCFLGFEIYFKQVLLFIPAFILGFILNFMISYAMSNIAFWVSEAWGIFSASRILFSILAGGFFPLEIFGVSLNKVFAYLPFKYTVYFCVGIITGRIPAADISSGLMIQLVWGIILALSASLTWNMGLKKYIAAGG